MAAETVALADDNFSTGGLNYYLYDHPKRGFEVLPWDFDTIFLAVADADPFEFWDGADPNKLRQLMNQQPGLAGAIRGPGGPDPGQRAAPGPRAGDRPVQSGARRRSSEDPNRVPSFQDFEDDCQALREKPAARRQALIRMLGR